MPWASGATLYMILICKNTAHHRRHRLLACYGTARNLQGRVVMFSIAEEKFEEGTILRKLHISALSPVGQAQMAGAVRTWKDTALNPKPHYPTSS